jgi:hypothetical protein
MSAVARAFPAGPTLATWWQSLAPLQPRELWVAHLALHRVEALVHVEHPCPLDRLSLRILDALARAETIEALEQQTGLHRQFLHRALSSLRVERLVDAISPGQWQLSAAGRAALDTGSYTRLVAERRSFHFRVGVAGTSSFVPLRRLVGEAWQPRAEEHFDSATLDGCLQRPRDWKEQHGFPLEVRGRATPGAAGQADWRQVTVVTPVHLTVALAVADQVRGFECASSLDTAQPIFALGSAGYDVLPELAAAPSADACTAAWREWCEAQNRPEAAAAGRSELQGHRLLVTPAAAIDARLQSRADESWLLIGSGEVRRAARIEIQKV